MDDMREGKKKHVVGQGQQDDGSGDSVVLPK